MDDNKKERQLYQMHQKGYNDIKEGIDKLQPKEVQKVQLVTPEEQDDLARNFFSMLRGKDGHTPVLGKDYLTPSDEKLFLEKATPIKGKHYFTKEDQDILVKEIMSKIPDPIPGKDGEDGKDAIIDYRKIEKIVKKEVSKIKLPEPIHGKDAVVDYDSIIVSVLKKIPPVDIAPIKEFVVTEVRKMQEVNNNRYRTLNSGGPTTRIGEIVDVDTQGAVANDILVFNGSVWASQKLQWGTIEGTLTDQTDLTTYISEQLATQDTLQEVTDNGATTTKDITAKSFITTGGTSSGFVKGDGSLDTTTYLNTTTAGTTYVPYTGATTDVNLGSQDLETTGVIRLSNTSSTDTGVIYKGTTPFIHNFSHPTGGTAIPAGGNTFVGPNAGNFTMGSTATSVNQASHNTGIGQCALASNIAGFSNTASGMSALYSNTTGYYNTASGRSALFSNTTGCYNTANGVFALCSNTTGFYNTASGVSALLSNTTGSYNTASGRSALLSNTTGSFNTASGMYALCSNTTGSYNTASGYRSGRFIADGTTPNATSNNSLYLGANTRPLADGDTNEIVIGYNATGAGSNTATLGNTDITKTILRGNVGIGTTTPSQALDVVGNININGSSAYLYDGYNAIKLATKGDTVDYTSTIIGREAGDSVTNGTTIRQTALGFYAGRSNTGANQTALGHSAGLLNTGNYQTALGYNAGSSNTGIYQTALGYYAGQSNTGANQTALGHSAGLLNTGAAQTVLGMYAGRSNTGNYQTAVGYSAGCGNTGVSQTALGYYAGLSNTGNSQTALGMCAGNLNTGANQTAVGHSAGCGNKEANQTALGYLAGYLNTGAAQTALGVCAGLLNTGNYQTALGMYAGCGNTGANQTALGYYAGNLNTGANQTAVGYVAGYCNTGASQTALGFYAGCGNTGANVTGIGYEATRGNQANDVVAIGYQAGKDNALANQFIVKQANLNTTPLIQGDFVSGNVKLPADNASLVLGAGDDASVYYNGTNLIINPKLVGSGILDVAGVLQTDGYNSASGNAGASGSFTTADSKTVTVEDGIIISIV